MAGAGKKAKIHYSVLIGVPAVALLWLVVFVTVNKPPVLPGAQAGSKDVLGAAVKRSCCELNVVHVAVFPDIDHVTNTKRTSVSLSLKNTSPTVQQISPGLQLSVLDTAGMVHPITARYLSTDATLGGPLDPGGTMSLTLDSDIPATAQAKQIIFQTDAGDTPIKVNL